MFTRWKESGAGGGVLSFSRPQPAPAASALSVAVKAEPAGAPAPAPQPVPQLVQAETRYEESSGYVDLKVKLHERLLETINLSALEKLGRVEIQREIADLVRELLEGEKVPLSNAERTRMVEDIVDELLGFGPLEPLLKDPTVNDILVNSYDRVFVERRGRLQRTPVKFKDEQHLRRVIDKIVAGVGRRVDESSPTVDARLPDGSRVNVVIPPIAIDGSAMSIRKFSKMPFDMDKLVQIGAMTREIADVLKGIVFCRLNVLISGGTGTGKTTMLNALSSFIDPTERIVTIEDAAELQLQQEHVVRLETRPPNIEGRGEIAQRELVKNALRMRPDRIILGECRSGEAFDMLQAMNTGHDGSMTTIHSNSPRDCMGRLETLIGMAGLDLPMRSIRAQIASAIDVVVQIRRFSDGRRRLISLTEITGMEGDVISMQEIFFFRQTGVNPDGSIQGRYFATGVRPRFFEKFEANGLPLPTLEIASHPTA